MIGEGKRVFCHNGILGLFVVIVGYVARDALLCFVICSCLVSLFIACICLY